VLSVQRPLERSDRALREGEVHWFTSSVRGVVELGVEVGVARPRPALADLAAAAGDPVAHAASSPTTPFQKPVYCVSLNGTGATARDRSSR
jgi:hypothetical protein